MSGPEHWRMEEGLREHWLHEWVEHWFYSWPWSCKGILEERVGMGIAEKVLLDKEGGLVQS